MPPKNPAHLMRCWWCSYTSSAPVRRILLGLGSRWDSTRRSVQSPKERRSRKSAEKLRLPHPTERGRATFRPKDDDEDTWLGLSSGPPMASSVAARGCCVPPRDAHAADATGTDTDTLLAAAAPLAYGVEAVAWCAYADEDER
jgi:hypothetical protein